MQYGSGLGIYEVDEGLSYGGNLNTPGATRAFEIVLDLLINSHDHDHNSTHKKDDFLKYREGHHASTIFSPNFKQVGVHACEGKRPLTVLKWADSFVINARGVQRIIDIRNGVPRKAYVPSTTTNAPTTADVIVGGKVTKRRPGPARSQS